MGCDGGTIPRRDELVKTKKKPEQKDKDAEAVARWKHCALTQQQLRPPVVSCDLGRLYNKESVIEFLLEKTSGNQIAKHIRSLKDVVTLELTENPGYQQRDVHTGDEYVDHRASKYICPVTGLEMNGKYRFCYIRTCGCVLSEKALKEVKSDKCHKCGKAYSGVEDTVLINGSEAEMKELYKRMEERRAAQKAAKKSKKRSAVDEPQPSTSGVSEEKKKNKTSSLSAASTSNGSGSATGATKLILPAKAKASYSIAKDPNASEALKSLFTTHQTALNQPKAHWVTHNPLFF